MTKLSRDDLVKVSEELAKISQSMPGISKEIDTLNKDVKTQLDGINNQQQQAESNIRGDLKALQKQLVRLQDVHILIKDQNQAAVDAQRQLQNQLQHTAENLETYSRTQEESLRQRQAARPREHSTSHEGQGPNIPGALGASSASAYWQRHCRGNW